MQSGEVLGGRFEIEHQAGAGGMGIVYRALDRETGRRVAVKVLYRRGASDLQRFEREATCLARLDHPGIVRYHAHGHDAQQAYLVMDWLEGESLGARLDRARLTLAETVALAARVAEALAAAHAAGVIHRDLKPSNLFLVDGALDRVEIIDFGLARGDDAAPITATGATLGTPGFMSPEQVKTPRDVDHRADLYSLGCVLFNALTGRPPHEKSTPIATMMATASEDARRVSAIVDGVPPALDDLVAGLLAREPERRPLNVAPELRAIEADIKARRLGWTVPQPVAHPEGAPATRETLSAGAIPEDAVAKRAFRPGETIDPRASTVTPEAAPWPQAVPVTLHAAEPPPFGAEPGSGPKVPSAPQPSGAPARSTIHPATAVLLTLLVVLVTVGGSCTACVYCTCIAPNSGPRAAPAPRPVAKDAGPPAPRPAARPSAR